MSGGFATGQVSGGAVAMGERRRTVDERFGAAGGEFCAVAGTGPEDDDTVRELTGAGVSSFCPAPGNR